MRNLAAFVTLLSMSILPACESSNTDPADDPLDDDEGQVVQRGERLLGIAISDRADGDFNTAFSQAQDAGMQVTGLPLAWNDIETAPGVYTPDPDFLSIAAGYYSARGTRVLLGLNPIDTNNGRLPAHLEGRAWDDPVVIEAFKRLLDWAMPRAAPLDLVALSIGNEIDGTLASDEEWEAYRRFFDETASYARNLRPGLRVGSKVTLGGLTGTFAAQAALLNETTDAVLTTYYPLGPGFRVHSPDAVHAVFDDVTARYARRPILFAEIGSPSTTQCGSSQTLQAEFVREAFAAWDLHADQIELLQFVWMHEISQATLDVYESYYRVSDPCFLEYLGTLGLKSPNGEDKAAWAALVREAGRRGW